MNNIQKKIFLLSDKNVQDYADVSNSGIAVEKYSYPVSDSDLKILNSKQNDYKIIIDTNSSESDNFMTTIDALDFKEKIIYVSNSVDNVHRQQLLKQGVADIFIRNNTFTLGRYIKNIYQDSVQSTNKIIVFEQDPARISILRNIITRFNYSPVFIRTYDEVCTHFSKGSVQCVLINIGTDYHELCTFIRNAYNDCDLKCVPVISYKDMNEGLYIHEVITGLNKLTKVILSVEELYSFLLDVLIKKELMPLIDGINISANYKELDYYAHQSLKKIYYICEGDLFDFNNTIEPDNLYDMFSMVTLMESVFYKIYGFTWLMHKRTVHKSSTCEVGV